VEPYRYAWTFGDGTPGSSDAAPKHVYTAIGTKTWTVTVTDALNIAKSASGTVTIDNETLSASCSLSPLTGVRPLTVTGTCSTSGGTGTYKYDWTWGDGTTISGADGRAMEASASYTHTYTNAGSFNVQLVLSSGDQSQTFNWTVTAQNPPNTDPSISCAATPNPVAGGSPAIVTCSYYDAEDNIGTWAATLGEAPSAGGSLLPASGAGVSSGSTFSFTYNTVGATSATINVSVLDGRGGAAHATMTVSVTSPPAATSVSCVAAPNPGAPETPVTITCTYNDTEGDVGSWDASLSEDPFREGFIAPTSGAGVAAGGTFKIDYLVNQSTTATITVNVDDGHGHTGSTTVTVEII
jgi:hypothetical protein